MVPRDHHVEMIDAVGDIEEAITDGEIDNEPLALSPVEEIMKAPPSKGQHDNSNSATQTCYNTTNSRNMNIVELSVL